MKYTSYDRQLVGKGQKKEDMQFFDDMVKKIDPKEVLLDMLKDKHGMVYPDRS